MNPNSTPSEGLCGPVAASGVESEARCPETTNAAQTGTQGPDSRALLLDTISTAINRAGYWLAIEGKRAAADAVAKLQDERAETWRRQAIDRGLALGNRERTLELVKATAEAFIDDHDSHDCAQAVLDALTAYQPKETP